MIKNFEAMERIGDGFGDAALASRVADALPFMQFAIEETSAPGNRTGKKPTVDPDHWLAVRNCGPSSRALACFLEKSGYEADLLVTEKADHMFLSIEAEGGTAHVDPTALQFLSMGGVFVRSYVNEKLNDYCGSQLPAERVLIFKPGDYNEVGEWMAAAIKWYWQTKTKALYAAGLFDTSYGATYWRRFIAETPQAEIAKRFAQIYDPDNLEPHDEWRSVSDYKEMYVRWSAGQKPLAYHQPR